MMTRLRVPDHFRRGIRLAIGVGVSVALGYALLQSLGGEYLSIALFHLAVPVPLPCNVQANIIFESDRADGIDPGNTRRGLPEVALLKFLNVVTGHGNKVADQVLQGCKWGAITCVVISEPIIGKVVQVLLRAHHIFPWARAY